jgi:tryptophan synthase beta chain
MSATHIRSQSATRIDTPEQWQNLALQIPYPMPKPLHDSGAAVTQPELDEIYTEECARIELFEGEYSREVFISVPGLIMDEYRKYRPTPLARARGLEKSLNYAGKIYYKREDCNPTGSHKPNTAIPQSFYARAQRLRGLVTDTGAGQWGAALAWSCHNMGLDCTVFMTRNSYVSKPYRRYLMRMCGARVYSSPSDITDQGRELLRQNSNHCGSLGIGMSEALSFARNNSGVRLALGCVSYYAAMHQTIIGQELEQQLQLEGVVPDFLIGCVGGGTNFIGFVAPFVACAFNNPAAHRPRMIAVESANVPVLTRGEYRYESQDGFGLTPSVKMYTLGRGFIPSQIHAGGLRYHGKSPILSLLVHKQVIEAVAVDEGDAFRAAQLFFEAEGILPAPESSHAIAQVLRQVNDDVRNGVKSNIVFCLSGTGYLDLAGYSDFFGLRDESASG